MPFKVTCQRYITPINPSTIPESASSSYPRYLRGCLADGSSRYGRCYSTCSISLSLTPVPPTSSSPTFSGPPTNPTPCIRVGHYNRLRVEVVSTKRRPPTTKFLPFPTFSYLRGSPLKHIYPLFLPPLSSVDPLLLQKDEKKKNRGIKQPQQRQWY